MTEIVPKSMISSKSMIPEGNKDPKFFTLKLRVFVI